MNSSGEVQHHQPRVPGTTEPAQVGGAGVPPTEAGEPRSRLPGVPGHEGRSEAVCAGSPGHNRH